MYIVKITNNTPLCKMVNFSRSVLKIYTGQKKFTRAAPVAPVTNIRYGKCLIKCPRQRSIGNLDSD